MIFTHATRLPIILRIGHGLLNQTDKIIQQHNLLFPNKLIVSMSEIYEPYADQLKFLSEHKFLVNSSQISEADKLIEYLQALHPDTLLLAVGGGQVIDVVKYAVNHVNMNYLSVPTALSNDGIYSPVAVLFDGKQRRRIGTNIPLGIIVDVSVVQKAPQATLLSGIGDVLSNQSALLDWQLSRNHRDELINDFAYTLSLMSVQMVRNLEQAHLGNSDFCSQLAYSLVMSGLAMEIAGTSRPCSGAEHSISHAIDELYPERSTFHGLQVAAASILTLRLHKQDTNKIITFMKALGMPVGLRELGFNDEEIVKILRCAQEIRPRFTIIHTVDINKALVKRIDLS